MPNLKTKRRSDFVLMANSLVSRAIFAASQLIATVFVVKNFTVADQAVYFLFIAILAIQFIFEAGLSQVIVVSVSRYAPQGRLILASLSIPEVRHIVHASFVVYARYALGFFATVTITGATILTLQPEAMTTSWHLPWLLATIIFSVRFFIIHAEAVIEGVGGIARIIAVRAIAQVVWIGTFVAMSYTALPLLAIGAATLALITVTLLAHRESIALIVRIAFGKKVHSTGNNWTRETGRFRAFVSATWIASFCITNLPVPILFALGGTVLTAKLGVASQCAGAIGVISAALSSPRMARASSFVASDAWHEFAHLVSRTIRVSSSAALTVALVALVGLTIAHGWLPDRYVAKLPTTLEAAPFLVASLCYAYMAVIAIFYRARHMEVFAPYLGAAGAVTVLGAIVAGQMGRLEIFAVIYAVAAAIIVLPSAIIYHFRLMRPPIADGAVMLSRGR